MGYVSVVYERDPLPRAMTRGSIEAFDSLGSSTRQLRTLSETVEQTTRDHLRLHRCLLGAGVVASQNSSIGKTRPRIVPKLLRVAALFAPHGFPEPMLTEAFATTLRALRPNPIMLAYGATSTVATFRLIHTPVRASRSRHWRLHSTRATISGSKRTAQ